ncbi:MAG: glycosyltransferase 87 family protein [Candidatus Altiarchaeota archaeon]
MKKNIVRRIHLGLILASAAVLIASTYLAYDNSEAFKVVNTMYSKDGRSFRPANLPFFIDDGYFLVNFTTNREKLSLVFFAKDCIEDGLLNGQRFYHGDCSRCKHCRGVKGTGIFNQTERKWNTLVIKTRALEGIPLFFVENEDTGVLWRFLAYASASTLMALLLLWYLGKDIMQTLEKTISWVKKNKGITLLLTLSFTISMLLAPIGQKSTDVDGWIIRAENIIHKTDWTFTKTEPDYFVNEHFNMAKPPGAYLYEFIILRLLFGFNHIYAQTLVKLPPIIGNLILCYLIWSILSSRLKDRRTPLIAAAAYALNPVVIFQAAVLGKHDALTLALVLLALRNLSKRRFSIYYGLSLVTKQLPLFFLPWLLIQKRMVRQLLAALVIPLLIFSPYLLDDPVFFINRLVKTHTEREPFELTWMVNLKDWGVSNTALVSELVLFLYFALVLIISVGMRDEPYVIAAAIFSLFIALNKSVLEQYIMWSMLFLLLVYFIKGNRLAGFTYLIGTFTCIISHEGENLLPKDLINQWTIVLALIYLTTAATIIMSSFRIENVRESIGGWLTYANIKRRKSR